MRKDVIQQRFRRKNNNNSKDESSNGGNSPMETASFVFQSNNMEHDDSSFIAPNPAEQLIKAFNNEQSEQANGEIQSNEFVKWYVPSSQASTPSSTATNEHTTELTQNLLLASLMNPNKICDIGV
jgi:hypothetical protein